MLQTADSLKLTTDVELAGGVEEILNGRVSLVVVTENLCSLKSPLHVIVNDAIQLSFETRYRENAITRGETHLSGL